MLERKGVHTHPLGLERLEAVADYAVGEFEDVLGAVSGRRRHLEAMEAYHSELGHLASGSGLTQLLIHPPVSARHSRCSPNSSSLGPTILSTALPLTPSPLSRRAIVPFQPDPFHNFGVVVSKEASKQ